MKKISNVLLTVFSIGVLLTLFAGGLSLFGYGIAMCIGGETATKISLFIFEKYFPWLIRICAVSVGFGLIGMYFSKIKALTLKNNDSAERAENEQGNI